MKACVQYTNIGIQQQYEKTFTDALQAAIRLYRDGADNVKVCQVYELSELAEVGETTPLADRMRDELEVV